MAHVDGIPGEMVEGAGPVLLMEVGGERGSRISLAGAAADKLGWRGQKTPWLARTNYRGPIVVTAKRIDGVGPVRFARVYGQHLRKLVFNRDDRNRPIHGYYPLPSATLFRSTGCYTFHISGSSFKERLLVRVIR